MAPAPRAARSPVATLVGEGSVYTVATVVQLSASLITLPIITRLLSPGEYGTVALAVLVQLLFGAVSSVGLRSVLSRTYFAEADGPAESRRLILSATLLSIAVTTVAELTSPLWLGLLGHVDDRLALRIALLAAVPSTLTALCQAYLRACGRPAAFLTLAFVSALGGQVTGIVLTASVPGADATTFIAGLTGGYIAAGLIGIWLLRLWRDRLASRRSLRESLVIGLPVLPHDIAWTVLALGDRAVIQRIDGSTAVARYQVAYTTGALALTLVSSIANAWMPIVYSAGDKHRWRVHNETLAAVQMLAGAVAAGLALAGPPLLRVVAPPSYHEGQLAGVIALVAASAFPWAVYGGATQVLLWYKRTRPLAWITPLVAVVNIALVAVLLKPFGLVGAASATLVAYCLLALAVTRVQAQHGSMRNFQRPIVLGWSATVALAGLGWAGPSTGIWVLIRGLLSVGVIVALALAVRPMLSGRSSDTVELDPIAPLRPVSGSARL